MVSLEYRGCTISTMPRQLAQSRCWSVDFTIIRHGRQQSFSLNEALLTEREADVRSVHVARRIIEGKVPGIPLGPLEALEEAPAWRAMIWLVVAMLGFLVAWAWWQRQ